MSNTPATLPTHYQRMLTHTTAIMNSVEQTTESFHKTSSQLKHVTLDINDLTPISVARHLTAVIERTRDALTESEINVRRAHLTLREAQHRADTTTGIDQEHAELDILDARQQITRTQAHQRGAIRILTQLTTEYQHILDQLGVTHITEEMYEQDEPRYHLMRAMSQALAAARARGGLIDEGNHIYLQDLGINGAAAQRELTAYLEAEQQELNHGRVPTFDMQLAWLNAFADKYQHEIHRYVHARGLLPLVPHALAQAPGGDHADQPVPVER